MRPSRFIQAACFSILPGLAVLGLMELGFSFLDKAEVIHRLDLVFRSMLTVKSHGWPYFAPALANLAFFDGFLLSWGRGSKGYRSVTLACRTDFSELDFSKCLVGAALRQGYMRSFVWPPQHPASVYIVPDTGTGRESADSIARTLLTNEQLTRRVRPVATTILGLPLLAMLVVLFAVGVGSLLSVLGLRFYRIATGTLGRRLAGAIASGFAAAYSMWQAAKKKVLTMVIRTATPVVCGTIAIVTTTMGVVLFGVAHVGLDTLAESGVFGLNEAAVGTLLELIDLQWRFLQEINWSWWVTAMEERHERNRDTLGKQREHHHHHNCSDGACPFQSRGDGESQADAAAHGHVDSHRKEATGNSGGLEEEGGSDADKGELRPVVHVYHHHQHHFYHHEEHEKPGWRQRWFWWWIFVRRRRELLGDKKVHQAPAISAETHQHGQLEAQARELLFCDFLSHGK